MLVAHHLIDILSGDGRGMLKLPGLTRADMKRMEESLRMAQKFDFGTLPFELNQESKAYEEALSVRNVVYTLPTLTDAERGFWIDNLIPLPFPICWYEFTLGGTRSGLLVQDDSEVISVERIDYTRPDIVFDSIVCRASRAESSVTGKLIVTAGGNMKFLQKVRQNEVFMDNNLGANVPLAIWMTLMLNSKTSEVRVEPAPAKLNKKRMSRGRAPLEEHRIVTIVPERFRKASEEEARGTHRPPRLHWRRSHLRHYDRHVPSAVWRPEKVHAGKAGWWVSVIPRMLVGRADLGEVSHEYRIEAPETPALLSQ